MEKSELRSLVFAALRALPRSQFDGIKSRVRSLTVDYQAEDDLIVHEILWELLTQGILAPGMNATNLDFPFFHVTEFGLRCIEAGEIQLYDPEGYIERLKGLVDQPLDDLVLAYVTQSLQTYLRGYYLASTVLLGNAAEQCVDLLLDALARQSPDRETAQSFLDRIDRSGRGVKRRLGILRTEVLRQPIPAELRDDLDIHLSGLYTLILHSRSDAGRVTLPDIDRDTAHGNLLVFPRYCQRVYQLLEWLAPANALEGGSGGEAEGSLDFPGESFFG